MLKLSKTIYLMLMEDFYESRKKNVLDMCIYSTEASTINKNTRLMEWCVKYYN